MGAAYATSRGPVGKQPSDRGLLRGDRPGVGTPITHVLNGSLLRLNLDGSRPPASFLAGRARRRECAGASGLGLHTFRLWVSGCTHPNGRGSVTRPSWFRTSLGADVLAHHHDQLPAVRVVGEPRPARTWNLCERATRRVRAAAWVDAVRCPARCRAANSGLCSWNCSAS